ncbi:ribonuclease HII [Thalassobacillus sp. CUG 92003]|uniref:ribonuclease HII n=1 Tax=Thalassobacillus sp. CUG 92003 TaxID=2736641 RepID=UPI00210704EF|nr:ribonuclease HII [Thalassobacillus sp. CUG 92003]
MSGDMSIREIKYYLEHDMFDEATYIQLTTDHRKGVQTLVRQHEKRKQQAEHLKQLYQDMMMFEQGLHEEGKLRVAGIDEAGRGPLAGPVVAASVILPSDYYLAGLYDSKQLSLAAREFYFEEITQHAEAFGIGIVDNRTIDRINIYEATKRAMNEAIENMGSAPDCLLVDAMHLPEAACEQHCLVKGDQRSVSIAAASVLAKVTRDRIMNEADKEFPGYHFHTNQGYGTKKHLEALQKQGASPYHRKSFSPVALLLG